ncbi:hypothetical protein [Curtobacterium oceanosedimentum]|uniref:Uncharacterized protein n=1 Tax=Curtobacterium oceanosedimentum TaxID=465820 RepID=A0A147DQ04_9MICO|nr:hypothetical protein [Curtobacterium oceanosedimentum]KTR51338.1 hypothetical protein NS359_10805 [Curtobacterium oceanosedimentum]
MVASREAVAANINALPNVSTVTVDEEKTTDGLSAHYRIAMDISAPSAGRPDEAVAELIDAVLPLAWSTQGHTPDAGVVLRIRTEPQLDIGRIAQASGWRDVGFSSNPQLIEKIGYQASFGRRSLDEQIGTWPVDAPSGPPTGGLADQGTTRARHTAVIGSMVEP